MITIIEGNPGAGKTYQAVRLMARDVERGRRVWTNLPLSDKFPYLSDVTMIRGWDDVLKLPVCEAGVGVVYLDEAQEGMSSWDYSRGARAQRDAVLRWVMRSRHVGYDLVVITQSSSNIDAVLRRIADVRIYMADPRKLVVLGFCWRSAPFFLATWWCGKVQLHQHVVPREARVFAWYNSYSLVVESESKARLGLRERKRAGAVPIWVLVALAVTVVGGGCLMVRRNFSRVVSPKKSDEKVLTAVVGTGTNECKMSSEKYRVVAMCSSWLVLGREDANDIVFVGRRDWFGKWYVYETSPDGALVRAPNGAIHKVRVGDVVDFGDRG